MDIGMVEKEKRASKIHVDIIPDVEDAIDEQRESGVLHTSFHLEYVLYQAIMTGKEEEVKAAIDDYLRDGLVVGMLSRNSIRQVKYWAVSCIAVAIHYAILGGLDETDAFNLSDQYIRHIDKVQTMEECIIYLREKAVTLTRQVKNTKEKTSYLPLIRKTIHYIHVHLHERLMVAEIAEQMEVSKDYLSVLFKKETGSNIHTYIVREKLEASKSMLHKGISYDRISYQFAFCSETHYITCFKREYGITPGEYKNNVQNNK